VYKNVLGPLHIGLSIVSNRFNLEVDMSIHVKQVPDSWYRGITGQFSTAVNNAG